MVKDYECFDGEGGMITYTWSSECCTVLTSVNKARRNLWASTVGKVAICILGWNIRKPSIVDKNHKGYELKFHRNISYFIDHKTD